MDRLKYLKRFRAIVSCPECDGEGLVSADPGVKICHLCEGSKRLFVYRNGAVAITPGGPFKGSVSPKIIDMRHYYEVHNEKT